MPQTGNPIAGHWWIQSMHPYRVQQASSSIRRRTGGFNPRIHTGCDNKESNYIYTRMTFQSTHPYRMRRHDGQKVELCIIVSIHAPIQGATVSMAMCRAPGLCFNPRTHTGCDLRSQQQELRVLFQSTHPYRVRRIFGGISASKAMFQSTHPYRVRLLEDIL